MIARVLHWTRFYYSQDTFQHVCRVAEYVTSNKAIPPELKERCYLVALMHDILEDTNFDIEDFRKYEYVRYHSEVMTEAILQLTHNKKTETYEEYIAKIPKGSIAYWVKLADMKDHLTLTDTLTEKLKEKYLRGLAILL